MSRPTGQESLFKALKEQEPALLTALLQRAKLYNSSQSYKELLDFVNRLPNLAPFNAMLLSIQKPGLRFAASEGDWRERFNRTVKEGARPLVILWPFAPVAFVYDIEDTEGEQLPDAVAHAFKARGNITRWTIQDLTERLGKRGIYVVPIEYGDGYAGKISADRPSVRHQSENKKKRPNYRICLNWRHDANVQFATLVHELAHLFLGHLEADKYLQISNRSFIDRAAQEVEAESVSYVVCHRAGVDSLAESYLAGYIDGKGTIDCPDVYSIMRAAGQVETVLGIGARTRISEGIPSSRNSIGSLQMLSYTADQETITPLDPDTCNG